MTTNLYDRTDPWEQMTAQCASVINIHGNGRVCMYGIIDQMFGVVSLKFRNTTKLLIVDFRYFS